MRNDLQFCLFLAILVRPAPSDDETSNGTTETDLVELFLAQCGVMRHLSELLVSLHSSGHFDYYPQYSYEVPVTSPDTLFTAKVFIILIILMLSHLF